jgi:hypothetical protein
MCFLMPMGIGVYALIKVQHVRSTSPPIGALSLGGARANCAQLTDPKG